MTPIAKSVPSVQQLISLSYMNASTLTSQIPQNGTVAMTGFNNGHNAF